MPLSGNKHMHHAIVQAAGAGQDALSEFKSHGRILQLQGRQRPPRQLQQVAVLRPPSSLLTRGVTANQMRVLGV